MTDLERFWIDLLIKQDKKEKEPSRPFVRPRVPPPEPPPKKPKEKEKKDDNRVIIIDI